ncbi:MAG TPA: acyl-CoA dehydrogenase family protein, partial [Halomonas sp.]|nr:acyl-CoA dehydrogenase family protein [Halomonas sp.]
ELPEDALLGEEGAGFAYLMQELPRERLGVGAQALGAMQGALELTLEWISERMGKLLRPRAKGERLARRTGSQVD